MDLLPAPLWQHTLSFLPLPLISILSGVSCTLRNRLHAFPALYPNVDLSFRHQLTDSAFRSICASLQPSSVLVLNFEGCKAISDESLQFVIRHFHQLRRLNISGCQQLSVGALHDIFTLQFLQCLECVDCSGFGAEGIPFIGRCTQLLELDISLLLNCHFPRSRRCLPARAMMSTAAVDALRNLRLLTKLKANSVPLVSHSRFLRDLKNLRHVELGNSCGFGDLQGLEHLEYVHAFSNNVTSLDILSSSAHCLLHLDVSYCDLSTLNDVQGLSLFPNLRVLVISGNSILSLDFCHSLPKLETLLMNDPVSNPLPSLQPLVSCRCLHALGMAFWRRGPVDLLPLSSLPLRVCSIQDSDVSSAHCLGPDVELVSYEELCKRCGVDA
eukprot:GILK01011345.1.p1 GENE.GILK01011345.1~~GILK01011345.1.p1  ORF type:complete len:392 (-),score=24.64 GILK01011345.1:84-1235(-)